MSTQTAQDLRAAAEILKRDGWTQGEFHSDDGCHCALGAIAVAIRGSSKPNPLRWKPWAENAQRLRTDASAVARSLGRGEHAPQVDVSDWNDEPDRTADEAIAALLAAADAAERADQ